MLVLASGAAAHVARNSDQFRQPVEAISGPLTCSDATRRATRPAASATRRRMIVEAVHNPSVTTATSPPGAPAISTRIHTLNRPNMVSVGVIVWLASELMFFAGLFGIYFTVAGADRGRVAAAADRTRHRLRAIFTIILVASSFTCQFGRVRRRAR